MNSFISQDNHSLIDIIIYIYVMINPLKKMI